MNLKNKNIEISIKGNTIYSIKYKDIEILNTTKKWNKKFPILWPAIGLNKIFNVNGKKYKIPKHGFWNDLNFKITNSNKKILLKSNVKNDLYPFNFKITQIISIENNNIKISTSFDGEDKIPIQFGYHPAFNIDKSILKIKDESININKDLTIEKESIDIKNINELNWDLVDTFILKRKDFLIENEKYNLSIKTNMKYVALWKNEDNYICVEPWSNLPAIVKENDNDILNKKTYDINIEIIER